VLRGWRIVGKFEADSPTVVDAILHLRGDLLVGQIGKEGEGSLSDAHGDCSLVAPLYLPHCGEVSEEIERSEISETGLR
jgi:hypothetical protein